MQTPGRLPARAEQLRRRPRCPGQGGATRHPETSLLPSPACLFGRAGSLIAGRTRPHPFNLFQQLGIEYRRGDPVGPLAHFPRSMFCNARCRRENPHLWPVTIFLQVGQRRLLIFFAITTFLYKIILPTRS